MKREKKILALEQPSWFNIANYQHSARFTALEWMDQIVKRKKILAAIKQSDQSVLDQEVPKLMETPLKSTLQNLDILSEFGRPHLTCPVRPLDFDDIRRLNETFMAYSVLSTSSKSVEDVLLSDVPNGSFLLSNEGFLVITLSGSNEEILNGVKEWLAKRRRTNPNESISGRDLQSQFDRWFDAKLLPYIDLYAWGKWTGKKVSDMTMVELLYPNEPSKDVSALRKANHLIPRVVESEFHIELLATYLRGAK